MAEGDRAGRVPAAAVAAGRVKLAEIHPTPQVDPAGFRVAVAAGLLVEADLRTMLGYGAAVAAAAEVLHSKTATEQVVMLSLVVLAVAAVVDQILEVNPSMAAMADRLAMQVKPPAVVAGVRDLARAVK